MVKRKKKKKSASIKNTLLLTLISRIGKKMTVSRKVFKAFHLIEKWLDLLYCSHGLLWHGFSKPIQLRLVHLYSYETPLRPRIRPLS